MTEPQSCSSPVLMMEMQQTHPPEGCGCAIVSAGSEHYPMRQPSSSAEDHTWAHTTTSAEVLRSPNGFLPTMVTAGQQMLRGTAQRHSAAGRAEQCVLCQLNLSMAILINWNWQKFTPGQCDMWAKCLYSYTKNPKTTYAVCCLSPQLALRHTKYTSWMIISLVKGKKMNLLWVSYQPNCHSVVQQVAYFIDGATTSVCFTGIFCQSKVCDTTQKIQKTCKDKQPGPPLMQCF